MTDTTLPDTAISETAAFSSAEGQQVADIAPEIVAGEIIVGRVMEEFGNLWRVNIGTDVWAELPVAQVAVSDLSVGDTVELFITAKQERDTPVQVSQLWAAQLATWQALSIAHKKKERIRGTIAAVTKGGLSVDVGMRAFLPASQVSNRMVTELKPFVGLVSEFEVIKFDQKRGSVVVSRRAIVEEERTVMREKLFESLAEGDVVEGTVVNFSQYGVFVDIGGVDGLIRNQDLSWTHVKSSTDVLTMGQVVSVKVLIFDQEGKKIALGYKQTQPDPWELLEKQFEPGKKYLGKVTKLADYGAFVELSPGIEGLIHMSEMHWTKRINQASELLQKGQKTEVMVLSIDRAERRISLGLKQTKDNPWTTLAERYPVGTKIKGAVRGATDFGFFVTVEEGIDGLVHLSDLSWHERVEIVPEQYSINSDVEAVVLKIDPKGQRLSLGIKQLEEDPWLAFTKNHPQGSEVKGKVIKLTQSAAIFELATGVEGSCHISQLALDMLEKVSDGATLGETKELAVLRVDHRARKITLSVKLFELGGDDFAKHMTDEPEGGFGTALGDALGQLND